MMEAGGTNPPPGAAAPVWVLADPRAGTAAQALGIAERLGLPFRVLPLEWGPLARLPLPWPSLRGLTGAARAALLAAGAGGWPGLVLSAGRRAAPVALWLGQRGARTVHAMRPGPGAGRFDLLVVGRHDAPRPAANLLPILGATHRLSPARLAAARREWAVLESLPRPRVALLVGGPVRGTGMAPGQARALVPALRRHFPAGGILASTSRRTGAAAAAALEAALAGTPHRLHRWGGAGANPYAGFLAWADAVVVTADSVSMLAEACGTGVPVLVAGEATGRHGIFIRNLYDAGLATPLANAQSVMLPPPAVPAAPAPRVGLDESGRVAARIRALGFV